MAVISIAQNKPVLPRVSDTSDLASNRANVYSGKALSFDGVNDYVVLPNLPVQSKNVDWTISMYIKPDTYSAPGYLFDAREDTLDGFSVYVDDLSGNLMRLNFYDNNGGHYFGYVIPVNEWSLITFQKFDADYVAVYINGEYVSSTYSSTTYNVTGNFYIGSRFSIGNFFDGNIGDVKVFNTTLTAEQIRELYQNPEQILPTGVSATDLVAWLPMVEGAGSYVYNGTAGATGTELVSNGGFDEVCQKWGITDNGYATITNGKVVWNAPNGSGANVVQYLSGIQAGKTYRVSFDYSVNRDGFGVQLGDYTGAITSTNTGTGRFTTDIKVGNANGGYFLLNMSAGTGDLVGYMDNVSVKEVVPQATGTISGATWVAGLPEPLPQTALIDWNKYDSLDASGTSNYYSGALSLASNSGTIILRHVPYPGSTGNYYYSLGSNTTGGHRALGRQSNNYWFVGYGTGAQDFTTQATINNGYLTDIVSSWDASDNVSIYKNGSFVQTAAKTLADLSGTRTLHLYRSNWTNGDPQSIVFWAYYDRQLSSEEINDIYNGVVEPTAVSDLKYYFTPQNGYSYNGVTLTKTGSFSSLLQPKGLTTGKDIFGNSIAVPRSSGAFNFDGASWATISRNSSVSPTIALTLEAWIKKSDKTSNTGYHHIISRNSSSAYYFSMFTEVNTGYLSFQATVSSTYKNSGVDVSNNSWNHCVVVYNKSNVLFYVNGQLVSTQSMTDALTDNTVDVYIGARPNGIQLFQSQIGLPRIYNYALTAEQVADNYNQKATTVGATGTISELQAYINRTNAAGATVEAHPSLLNTLTELDSK